jgi:photosystem II stability/assembly factor-like uncharacterized protein
MRNKSDPAQTWPVFLKTMLSDAELFTPSLRCFQGGSGAEKGNADKHLPYNPFSAANKTDEIRPMTLRRRFTKRQRFHRFQRGVVCILFFLCCRASKREIPLSGLNWIPQQSGTTASLRGICAVNSRIAWASGSGGTVLRTVDGGETWTRAGITDADSLDFRDIYARDAESALVLSAGLPARVYGTRDGGQHWTIRYENRHPQVFFNAMAFWDHLNGIAVSDPVEGRFLIIRTTDGGKTWEDLPASTLPAALPGEAGFAASGTCLAAGKKNPAWFGTGGPRARIIYTRDRGETWHASDIPILSGNSSSGIFSLAFTGDTLGVAVGGDYRRPGYAYRNAAVTFDGGATWTEIREQLPAGFCSCVAFLPDVTPPAALVTGTHGSDLSLDAGRTWVPVDTVGYHSLSFTDERVGWAVGSGGRISKIRIE